VWPDRSAEFLCRLLPHNYERNKLAEAVSRRGTVFSIVEKKLCVHPWVVGSGWIALSRSSVCERVISFKIICKQKRPVSSCCALCCVRVVVQCAMMHVVDVTRIPYPHPCDVAR